jgi:hypothetical protein
LPTSVRYDIDALGWNGYFTPTWTWQDDYSPENHIIEFKISETVGIEEASLGITSNAFPNPASDQLFVDYALQNDADVIVELTDLAGRVVLLERQGERSPGQLCSAEHN